LEENKMNEAILVTYLDVLQEGEPEYMTEGIRSFIAKFDKAMFKRTVDKLHHAFSMGDGDAFNSVVKQTAKIGKIPKQKEVSQFMDNVKEENPGFGKAVDLSKKVIKNTFKIRNKDKLEIMANMVGMAGWIKSKGGRRDPVRETKIILQEINSRVANIYEDGFESMEATTPEEEEMKKRMMTQAKKQEKNEMIIVSIILSILTGAIVWAGIAIWSFFTSGPFLATVAVLGIGALLLKVLMWAVGISAVISGGVLTYLKATGGA